MSHKCVRCDKQAEGYNRSKAHYCAKCWEQLHREEERYAVYLEVLYRRRVRSSQYERLRYEEMRTARYGA